MADWQNTGEVILKEEAKIEVRMLGEFSLSFKGTVVSGNGARSSRTVSLLAYLICHRERMVPVSELIHLKGTGKDNSAPVAALRTMLCRVRRMISPIEEQAGKALVITKDGRYGWNPECAVDLDTERLEEMYKSLLPDGRGMDGNDCIQMLELYRGDFLQHLSDEQWTESFAAYYREIYIAAVRQSMPRLMEKGLLREAIGYCRNAIPLSPYCEELYRWQMKAYLACGEAGNAIDAYERLRLALYEDLGVFPGEETEAIYQESVLKVRGESLTIDQIREQLQERGFARGAMVCDYTTFQLFYQAEARAALRRGDAVHIGVFSVSSRGKEPLTPKALHRAMEQMRTQICTSLRTGDIVSCCSPSQYIIMLVQANYENSQMVCERVERRFYCEHPRSPARVKSTLFSLKPTLMEQL